MTFDKLRQKLNNRTYLLLLSMVLGIFLLITHIDGMPMSYDFGGHISRIYILLNDGIGWTDMWYNGHPLLTFYPPLYHLIFGFVGAISMELIRPFSFGILGIISFFSMYSYSSKYLNFHRSAASGFLFLSGWLLYIAHISGSMPQAYAAALIPIFFSELENSLKGKTPVYAGLLGGIIILFHHNAALVAALGALILIAVRYRENILNALSAGLISLGVAGFWILPALQSFSDASYSLITNIGGRGMENVVLLMPLFAVAIVAKVLGSLNAAREYREQTIIGLIGLIISFGFLSFTTSWIPFLKHLPPYRFFVLTSFAASFLASAADKRILGVVFGIAVISSGLAVQTFDDRGYYAGQKQAYDYVQQENVELLYDSEDTDLRAYAITIHGKDIADGWSVGSSSIRPGLMLFSELQTTEDEKAAEFLHRWSVTHALTYKDNEENRKLHRILNNSDIYSIDRCFQETCVFEAEKHLETVISHQKGEYIVNASEELPIPYSSRFNVTKTKSSEGFLQIPEKEGIIAIKYVPSILRPIGAILSITTLAFITLAGRRDISVPASYSKEFRNYIS